MTRHELRCIDHHLEIEWNPLDGDGIEHRCDLGPLPDRLSRLVNRVLADFQQPTPVDIELGYADEGDGSGTLSVSETGDGTSMGFAVLADEDDTAFLVRFADTLQEQFFPESVGAWGEARPECPGHAHPAEATEMAGEAWWTCPVDGRRVGVIGRSGSDERSVS
jgi:hypothetical protein